MLLIKSLIGLLIQIVIMGAILLFPADTWLWSEGIILLVVWAILGLSGTIYLSIFYPKSLEARMIFPIGKRQPVSDRFATIFIIIVVYFWLTFIPMDVFKFKLLPAPIIQLQVLGLFLVIVGYVLTIIAIIQNEFATPSVINQSDRGQELRDKGIYGKIRHPFYLGFLVCSGGIPLWLRSYAGLIGLSAVLIGFVGRILVEERILRKTLPGYSEYTARVPYRLVPFLW